RFHNFGSLRSNCSVSSGVRRPPCKLQLDLICDWSTATIAVIAGRFQEPSAYWSDSKHERKEPGPFLQRSRSDRSAPPPDRAAALLVHIYRRVDRRRQAH